MFDTERSRLTLVVTVISVENVMGHSSIFVKVKESDPPLFGDRFSFVTDTLATDNKSTLYWRQALTGSAGVKLNTKPPLTFQSIGPSVLRFR